MDFSALRIREAMRSSAKTRLWTFFRRAKFPIKNAEHFVTWMFNDFDLDKQMVMVAPGSGFYTTPSRGLNEVRIAYILKEEDLKKAIRVFQAGLEKQKKLFG